MFKRLLGIVLLIVGLMGALVSVGGAVISRRAVGQIGSGLETTLALASDSLTAVEDTLILTKTTVEQVNSSVDTLAETAGNVSVTMRDTQPLMDSVTETATQRIPDSIESIQQALPNVAEAAGAIDDTLRVLDSFSLDRRVFGVPLQFDLGIDYQPSAPLDETVLALGDSLEGVPEELRLLETDLVKTSENLVVISRNVDTIATDLESISEIVDEIDPLLDQYLAIVTQTQDLIAQAESDLASQMALLQLALTALFVWFGLNQIVPLYLGWTLMTGGDVEDEDNDRESEERSEDDEGDDDKGDDAR